MSDENATSIFDILTKVNDNTWEVSGNYKPGMNVPGRIFVSKSLLDILEPETIDQVANVASPAGNPEILHGNAGCTSWLWILLLVGLQLSIRMKV